MKEQYKEWLVNSVLDISSKVIQGEVPNVGKVTTWEIEDPFKAVHWFSLGEKQPGNENKILALITCLETFLTSEYGNPIRNTVAEGSAIILENTLEKRKYIKQRINEFYKQRSSISHGGGSKNILNSDIIELKQFVQAFIQEMIRRRNEFQNRKDVLEWIDDQKLS